MQTDIVKKEACEDQDYCHPKIPSGFKMCYMVKKLADVIKKDSMTRLIQSIHTGNVASEKGKEGRNREPLSQ